MVLPPPPRPRWIGPAPVPRDEVEALARTLQLPPPVAELLVRRGLEEPGAARAFLRPAFDDLRPAELLPDVGAAVDRVLAARDRGETVLVHGDYDADGLCAAALLTRGLSALGLDVRSFVPHRLRDGYDLGPAGLERAREEGVSLVVTADCGISAVRAVEDARAAGLDVVVTDHHRPPPRLPAAAALVNPAREDGDYPFAGLSGAGVAYKVLAALFRATGRAPGELNRHLDLVALGTVADVVPLVDENRVLVRAGLRVLERTEKPGLRALARHAGLSGEMTAGRVGYVLGPRLNAAGRVGEAEAGLRLLLTDDPAEADALARCLEDRNRERREMDRRVLEEVEGMLDRDFDPERRRSVVLWSDGWHPGVIGIVASRVVERVHRPTVLVSLRGDVGRGSGRSVRGFHLHRALSECSGLLERFGGHRMAAGLEIRREKLEAFASRMEELARERLEPGELSPELRLDLALPLARADADLHRWLEHFAPFGAGNPRPVLASDGVGFSGPRRVGREGAHLKATLRGPEGGRLDAVGFGMGERADQLAAAGPWEVAYELREDEFQGRRRLQARLRDVRPGGGREKRRGGA